MFKGVLRLARLFLWKCFEDEKHCVKVKGLIIFLLQQKLL